MSSHQGKNEHVGHGLSLGLERVFYKWIDGNFFYTHFEEDRHEGDGE